MDGQKFEPPKAKISVQKILPCGRKWDKKHSCLYCGKLYSKMARHLESKHNNEIEVGKALAYKKGSRERKNELHQLLHRGDFKHNKSVIDSKNGFLIPARRQSITDNIDKFTTCEECFGLFLKKDLWRHKKNCVALSTTSRGPKKNVNLLLLSATEGGDDSESDFQEKILKTMSSDRISLLCRNDSVIVQFGKNLFSKFLDQPHQFQYIKQKMREIGRFLNEMKNESEIENITQCIDPQLFSTIIKVIKVLAKYDCNTGLYETPSLALKLGHSLKACADILKSKALQTGDNVLEKQAKSFIKLYTSDWSHQISSRALNTMHKRKYNATRRIPLAKDVQLLYKFLQGKLNDAQKSLNQNPNPTSWKNLAEVVLAQVVLFNRRRGGEMQRMKLEDYQNGLASGKSLQGEILQSLSGFERNLARQLERVEIRGKRGRRVPVLLTKCHKSSIDLLLDFRQSSGLSDNNLYMFGAMGEGENALRTSDILRKFAKGCGANQPNLLTSTALRKHIGTICQLLNLKENELEALATFMGHDKSVHKEYYRLPEDTMQLAKVSKILLQLEKGKIDRCKGKNLDDLDFADNEAIEEDELSADEDDLDFQDQDEGPSKTPTTVPQIECFQEPNMEVESSVNVNIMSKSKKVSTRVVKQSQRKEWSVEEKQAVEMEFRSFFFLNRLPGKAQIESAMKKYPILANRPWKQIKYYIKNVQGKKQKI